MAAISHTPHTPHTPDFSIATQSPDTADASPPPAAAALPLALPSTAQPSPQSMRDHGAAGRWRALLNPSSVGAIGGVSPPADPEATLRAYVADLFAPYKDGSNDAAIDQLAAERADGLLDAGQDVDRLRSLFAYAHAVDLSAHMAAGGTGALPFAVANAVGGQLATWMPHVRDVNIGLLSGFLTYLLVHVGGGVNGRLSAHTPWQQPADLAPVMAAALAARQPGAARQYKEMLSFQGFPAAFATVGELPVLAHLHSAKAGALAQSVGGPVTALIGGTAVAGIDHAIDERHGRSGPALLLASQSWQDQLVQLEQRHDMPNWHGRAAATLGAGARRVASGFGEKLVRGLGDAATQLGRQPLSTLASAGIWGGGLAASNFASNQLGLYMAHQGVPAPLVAATKQLVFAASLSPINAAWTAVLAFGPAVDRRFADAVRAMVDRAAPALPVTRPAGPDR